MKNFKNLNDFYKEFKRQLITNAPNSVKFEDYVKRFEFGDSGERVHWVDENGKGHWKILNPWLAVDLSGKEENSLFLKPPYWEYTSEYRPHYEIYEKLKKMYSDYSQEISPSSPIKSSFENKREKLLRLENNKENNFSPWLFGGVIFIMFGLFLVYLFRKTKKK